MDNPNNEQENPEEIIDTTPPRATQREIEEDSQPPIGESRNKINLGRFNFNNDWVRSIVASIVTVLFILFIVLPMAGGGNFVTKKDFESNFANISASINETISTLNTKSASLDTALNGLSSKVDEAVSSKISNQLANITQQANNAVSSANSAKETANNFDSKINTLTNDVATLTSKITALIARIDAIEVAIDEILAEEDTGGSSGGNATNEYVTVKLKIQGGMPYMAVSDNQSQAVMRIIIENKTDKDIEDVVIGLYIIPYPIQDTNLTTMKITGGALGWIKSATSDFYFYTGGWGYKLKSHEIITIDIGVKCNNIGNASYTAEASIIDWSYK